MDNIIQFIFQGICGTSIGLIISAVCETQQDATQIALGIFYPNLILSGIIWPIESMPVVLRYLSKAIMFNQTIIISVVKIRTTIFIFFLIGTWHTYSPKRLRWRRCGEFCCAVGESHTCQFGEVF